MDEGMSSEMRWRIRAKRIVVPVLAATLSACATLSDRHAVAPAFALDPADSTIVSEMRERDVTGLAFVPIRDCKPGPARYFGMADRDDAAALGDDTVFEAASISKAIFAYLVMGLVEDGIVDLDRPFALDIAYPRIVDQAAFGRMTPRMALSHSTGMPNWAEDPTDKARLSEPIALVAAPGEGFHYSGEGYQLLEALVVKKSGQTLEALFRDRLGDLMPASSFAEVRPGRIPAIGYRHRDDELVATPASSPLAAKAAAGLLTTAPDLAAFVGHLCKREGLKSASYDEMWQIHNSFDPDGAPPERRITAHGMGLGFEIERANEHDLVSHSGNNGDFMGFLALDRTARDGIVYLTNDSEGLGAIAAIYGFYPWVETEE